MDILVSGSIAYDYLMRFPGKFTDHILPDKLENISLSFLVESMIRRQGGTAPNIAYNMALLGCRPRLFATVGEDFDGYRQWLEQVGVDTSLVRVIPEVGTASFFANTDRANNQIASFYPGAMAHAAEMSIYDLDERHPDLVVISPTEPAAMDKLVRECRELFIPYVYDPSQQIVRLEREELRRGIQGARVMFANDYEFGLIQKHTGMSPADVIEQVKLLVITLGKRGSRIMIDGEEIEIPTFPESQIADPTGVGDAYRGGFLTGYSRGWDARICGMIGSLCATYCLEVHGPQAHQFTRREFIQRFRTSFDDEGLLTQLL